MDDVPAENAAFTAVSRAEATEVATSDMTLLTQPSSISVATPATPARWSGKRRSLVVGGVSLATASLIVAGFLLTSGSIPRMESRAMRVAASAIPAAKPAATPSPPEAIDLSSLPTASESAFPKPGPKLAPPAQPSNPKKRATGAYDPLEHL
jgi:hypothetical protein